MSYGMRTWRANGSVAMDGSNKAGIFMGAININYSASGGSRVFTQIPAGYAYVLLAYSGGQFNVTVDSDGAGHARVNWVASGSSFNNGGLNSTQSTTILVFARKVNQNSTYGMPIYNDSGDMPLDITYPVPQYAGTVQPSAYATSDIPVGDGYTAHAHTAIVGMRPDTNRIILVNLPDSTNNDFWYHVEGGSFLPVGAQAYDPNVGYTFNIPITLTVFKPYGYGSYQVPSLHVFCLDGPLSGGGSMGLQYHDNNNKLVYDSSAENITIADTKNIDYNGNTQSIAMNLPAQCGIYIPYLVQDTYQGIPTDINGNNVEFKEFKGIVQRRGSNLYYRMILTYDTFYNKDIYFNSQSGVSSGNFTMAVDISQLGPTTVTGIRNPQYNAP